MYVYISSEGMEDKEIIFHRRYLFFYVVWISDCIRCWVSMYPVINNGVFINVLLNIIQYNGSNMLPRK